MSRSTPLFFALLLALGGCEGALLDGPTGPRGAGGGRDGAPLTCGGAPSVAPSLITRLTRTEYDFAIEDLLGDTSRPARTFAPDDITTGFEVGGAVSPLLVEQYLETATSIAERATADLGALTGCDAATTGETCARRFVERIGRRAFRRPLRSEETDALIALYREGAGLVDHRTGIQLVLESILVSPSFLYHVEGAQPDAAAGTVMPLSGYEVASRLAFFLWRSLPDDELLDAADAGELDQRAGLELQTRRMLEDPRALRGLHDFTRQWLDLDRLGTVEKDVSIHPEFDRALASDMRASIEAYVDEIVRTSGDFDTLLLGNGTAYVNARLAPIYGLEGVTGDELRPVSVDPAQRAGLLTQPGLLALLAKSNQSDPIHRGIFVRQRLLCQQLPPPPPDVDTTPPDLVPGLTTRERFGEHRDNPACSSCHTLIDPIGFGFEGYDAVGRFRATEEGRTIDASGELVAAGDASGPFDGVIELGALLASSETVHECIARQWFRYAVGRVETAQDRCSTEAIDAAFSSSGHDVRELVVALVTSDAFTHRRIPEAR